ncbi:hypothetical protein [Nostoc parmelioides]|uniref:Uncharacterized protein n=1 Tax=Nostoc parmelioides FACHB-3921 TaxID=2692909 RepID=A0ABR8BPN1_9NOSO|nr:hypothetical protein [Nostoc parmelioides]MBD2255232.1 hypothetical protein [Nostoc parmelioides FACHB-3921]
MVKNLHGSRIKEFWDKVSAETEEPNSTKQQSSAEILQIDAGSEEMRCKYTASIVLVESMGAITPRTSLLNLDVRIYTHPASDILRLP